MSFLSKWRWTSKQRQTYKELSRLSDRELRDIGLVRCDIWHVVESMSDV